MKNKTVSIRLNPEKLVDRKIEEVLSNLPARRKSEYIRNAIIAYDNQEKLFDLLKKAVLEAMEEQETKQAEKRTK